MNFEECLMTFEDYQQKAARTINEKLTSTEKVLHSLHGMAGETGELHSLYQKAYQGKPFDMEHAMKEVGDLLWFIAEWCTANGISMDEVARMNIDKLLKRYKNGFSVEESEHRAEGDV